MPSKLMTLPTFKTWWTKHKSWKIEEKSWNAKGRCSTLDLKEATQGSVLVLPRRELISAQVSRVGSRECELLVKDFRLLNGRFSATTSSLLTLHPRHRRGTTMCKILVLWDHAIAVVRLGTTLTGVQGSRPIRLQQQAQIKISTAMLTTVQQLQQGRIKLVLV
jgi:hypothetical protein